MTRSATSANEERATPVGVGVPGATRVDGYAPIEDYAAIGDGRTVALVAKDGSIDWLPVPHLDDPPVFSALLDAERGGRFALAPVGEYEVERSYVSETNVLQTTFHAEHGRVTITDALTLQDGGLLPWLELARRVECVRGELELEWCVKPRFDYGLQETRIDSRRDAFLASLGNQYLSIRSWGAGEAVATDGSVGARFTVTKGDTALLVCVLADRRPIPFPPREEVEQRFDATTEAWRRWTDECYDGPWRDAVVRSALALKLLIQAPTGAIAAAATSSLPERIGGDRNYDYRFSWIRDSAFTLDALARLGFREQVHASLSWLLQATWGTHPRMQPFYAIGGGVPRAVDELPLHGYRGSKPVYKGNRAEGQAQLADYGDLLETVSLYVEYGNSLDRENALRIVEIADFVCRVWMNEDSGIWELDEQRHYTLSKMGCWVALDRAQQLAGLGEIPNDRVRTWGDVAERIQEYVERECWSETRRAYTLSAGREELDAAVLLAARNGYCEQTKDRLSSTIDAVVRELGRGPLVYRYSGQQEVEGAFLPCSFWVAAALAYCDRRDEARELMDELVELSNDVGLYAEEMDPASRAMLGNFPQALTHLALINAAVTIEGDG